MGVSHARPSLNGALGRRVLDVDGRAGHEEELAVGDHGLARLKALGYGDLP
jgi:hypothetical protein